MRIEKDIEEAQELRTACVRDNPNDNPHNRASTELERDLFSRFDHARALLIRYARRHSELHGAVTLDAIVSTARMVAEREEESDEWVCSECGEPLHGSPDRTEWHCAKHPLARIARRATE